MRCPSPKNIKAWHDKRTAPPKVGKTSGMQFFCSKSDISDGQFSVAMVVSLPAMLRDIVAQSLDCSFQLGLGSL